MCFIQNLTKLEIRNKDILLILWYKMENMVAKIFAKTCCSELIKNVILGVMLSHGFAIQFSFPINMSS